MDVKYLLSKEAIHITLCGADAEQALTELLSNIDYDKLDCRVTRWDDQGYTDCTPSKGETNIVRTLQEHERIIG